MKHCTTCKTRYEIWRKATNTSGRIVSIYFLADYQDFSPSPAACVFLGGRLRTARSKALRDIQENGI